MNKKQFFQHLLQATEISSEWVLDNEKDIKKFLPFIWDTFKYVPRILKYVNEHTNVYDYSSYTLYEKVLFFHEIVKQSKVNLYELDFDYPQKKINRSSEMALELRSGDDNDRKALWHMVNEFKIADAKDYQITKTTVDSNTKKIIQDTIEQEKNKLSQTRVIDTLTQEIIDQEELTLFDISIIESRNQVRYVMLDKNNMKVIYYEPYKMRFKYHPSTSILDKDYFVDFSELYEYQVNHVRDWQQIRKAINTNFTHNLKGLT